MGKKLLITEDDRKHILSLYGLINEVETEPESSTASSNVSTTELTLDKTINFGPGHYGLTSGGSYKGRDGKFYKWDVNNDLNEGLTKIKEFLKSNPTGYVLGVKLLSGESQIPNDDALGGGKDLQKGELSKNRLESLKNYLTPIFESWKTEGINTDFKIEEKNEIGKTPWVGSVFCPPELTKGDAQGREKCYTNYVKILKDSKNPLHSQVTKLSEKYLSEQYFRVIISVNKTNEPESTAGVETDEKCNLTKLKIVVSVDSHSCNNAEFFLLANTTVLYNSEGGYTANGNNSQGALEFRGYVINPQRLNPGYGWLPNGDGTRGNYKYGVKTDPNGDKTGERSDTFTVTPEQAETILNASTDRKIHFWYICVLEEGGCHLDMPNVTIYYGDEVIVDAVKPKSNISYLTSIDQCGQKESLPKTLPSQPDVTEWRAKYLSDRLGFAIDNELEGEIDGKQLLLKGVNNLNNLWKAHLTALTNGGQQFSYYPIDVDNRAFRSDLKEKWNELNPELYAVLRRANTMTNTFFDNFNKKVVEYGYSAKLKKDGELKFRGKEFDKDTEGMFQDIKQNLRQLYEEMGKIYTFELGKSADEYQWGWNLPEGKKSLSTESAIANIFTKPILIYYSSNTGEIVKDTTVKVDTTDDGVYKY